MCLESGDVAEDTGQVLCPGWSFTSAGRVGSSSVEQAFGSAL